MRCQPYCEPVRGAVQTGTRHVLHTSLFQAHITAGGHGQCAPCGSWAVAYAQSAVCGQWTLCSLWVMGIMQFVGDGQSAAGVSWVLCCRRAMGSVQLVYHGQWLMGSVQLVYHGQ